MKFSEDAAVLMENATKYAKDNKFEYITPEMLLLFMFDYKYFTEAFEECEGNIAVLKKDIERYIDQYIEKIDKADPELSVGSIYALSYAGQSALNSSCEEICVRHILHGIWQIDDSHAVYYMKKQGIEEADLQYVMAVLCDEDGEFFEDDKDDGEIDDDEEVVFLNLNDGDDESEEDDIAAELFEEGLTTRKSIKKHMEKKQKNEIKQYAPCLNDIVNNVNPLIGREEELERTIQILCRKDKNNPLHIGEPGVGKTAITYGLVKRINEGDVPEPLKDSKVFSIDLGGMLAGTQYRGDFEKRLKKTLSEIEKQKNPIIYIDEIHNLAGAGAVGESSFDAGNMLKPYLAEGKIRFIGATTYEEYKKHFEKNKSLVRRFQNVEIKEPNEEETLKILKGLKSSYEEFHQVTYDDEVLSYAVSMSAKYINERYLPDKAIDLIDEAGAYAKLNPQITVTDKTSLNKNDNEIKDNEIKDNEIKDNNNNTHKLTVDKNIINMVLTKICRVPVETVRTDEADGLKTLESRLKGKIFGQDEAIGQVVNAIKFSRAGLLEEGKPLASLLFVGPTGVGKTEVAKTLAEELGVKLIRFDMSEYGEKHAVAKLIGSPAGYVGYDEGGLLTEEIRKNPSSVLLLDEIEKAHPDIYNILLQVMDYATLTDNQGRKADFRNVVVIMTSNAGANRIGKAGIGFTSVKFDSNVITDEVNKTFQPEFRNRLNKIVIFNGMDDFMAERIVEKKLGQLKEMLLKKNITMSVSDDAFALVKKKGITEDFGAREVDRVIRNEIKPLLVDDILFGKLKDGGELVINVDGDKFVITS